MPYLAGYVTPQDYGALGNGSNDDTAAVQSAVNSGAPVFFPPGTYLISSAVALPTTAFLFGAGSGTYNVTAGANLSIIRLANGSNSSLFTIAAGNGAGVIRDMQFDGNKSNQTGTSAAIAWASAGSSQEAQWHLERVFVHDAIGDGITIGTNRQNNKFTECVVFNCGGNGIGINATDSAVINCTIGANVLDGVLASSVCHISGSDIFSNRNGINIPSGVRGVEITNCGIDRNNQRAVYVAGSSVDIVACTIHSNGQQTTNTYGSITVDDTFGAIDSITISHCNFWLDGGITNLPRYHIMFNTVTSLAQVSACSFQAGSFGTGTVSNNSQAVQTTVKNVLVGGSAALGDNGVGELQLANATTVPTTNPTAGGVIYGVNGTPYNRDPNGTVRPLIGGPQAVAALPGSLAETIHRYSVTTSSAPVSGTLYIQQIYLPAGATVSHIGFATGTTAASGPTHWWAAVLDNTYKQQAHSADQTTGAIAASTWFNLAMAANYTTTYSGVYYLSLVIATSTTQPTILQSGTAPAAQFITGTGAPTPLINGASTASLTTPGTDGTTTYAAPTVASAPFYLYCS